MAKEQRSRNLQRPSDYYTHGAAARQLAPSLPQHQPKPKRQPKVRYNKVTEYYFDIQQRHISSFLWYALLAVVVLGALGYMALESRLDYNWRQVQQMRTELASISATNTIRRDAMYANVDIQEVERIATQELFMAPPAPYQFMQINVHRQSYFVPSQSPHMPAAEEFTWGGLLAGLRRNFLAN